MSEVGQENKDPGEDYGGGGIQIAIFQGCCGHCEVGGQVSNPFSIGQHVIARGANNVQPHDQDLGSHKQHGH